MTDSPFLPDWLWHHAARRPDAPAVATPTARLTYGELAERVRALAGHLAAGGIAPGDRVLLALPNTAATVVVGLAVHAAGAVAVEVNREWGGEILAGIAARSRSRQAFVWGRDAETWGKAFRQAGLDRLWIVHPGEPPPALLAKLAGAPAVAVRDDGRLDPSAGPAPGAPAPAMRPEDTALILYTSGSTGLPRGVVQTFRNVAANARSIVQYLGLTDQDRASVILPLYYCYGRSVLHTHLLAGGSIFLDNRFAFPRTVLEAIGAEGCTGFAGVPLTFEIIRRQVNVSTIPMPRLRYLTQAGGPMSPDTVSWVRQAFQPARLFVMYGQTEATARLSYLPPERGEEKRGSIGIPIPGVELSVVDDAGRELPPEEIGHLVARGDNVTLGYLDDPEETAAILHDGWLWTGDLVARDRDGFFFHKGRSKEILKVGGHRVSPVEIEHRISRHPGVAEVAVLGAKSDLKGEVPIALVVARPGAAPTDAELRRFCAESLPPYMVPTRFTLVPRLPRNEAGKLLRAQLADLLDGDPPRPSGGERTVERLPDERQVMSGESPAAAAAPAPRPRLRLGELQVDPLGLEEAIDAVEALVLAGRGGAVFTPNVDHVVKAERDEAFREAYACADLSLADGTPLVWASRLLGAPLPERVAGSDLVIPLARRAAARGFRVYLLGGAPGDAERAAEVLARLHGVTIAGVDAPRIDLGPSGVEASRAAAARVGAARADLVYVALGAPKQEIWIHRHRTELGSAVALGIGASLAFVAGTLPRAPRWISRAGLEWLYRLGREPRRLWRRYLVEDVAFIPILARTWRRRRADGR